jgi:peptidylprolyl isomerase domain and WD repeat-containing protein 1
MKLDTGLFTLAKAKTHALSIDVSRDGSHFVVLSGDRRVRVFAFLSGRLTRTYDESLEVGGPRLGRPRRAQAAPGALVKLQG